MQSVARLHEREGRGVEVSESAPIGYPLPSSAAVTAVMRANRKVDTSSELRLRSALHRRGLRFRKHLRIDVGAVRVTPDVVFPRRRVAVFVDGCFWHGCPEHGTRPATNVGYWSAKLARNRERDARVNDALSLAGWEVLRLWEHLPPEEAVATVTSAVRVRMGIDASPR